MQAIGRIAAEEDAKLFVPVSIAQYSVYEALAAELLSRYDPSSIKQVSSRPSASLPVQASSQQPLLPDITTSLVSSVQQAGHPSVHAGCRTHSRAE